MYLRLTSEMPCYMTNHGPMELVGQPSRRRRWRRNDSSDTKNSNVFECLSFTRRLICSFAGQCPQRHACLADRAVHGAHEASQSRKSGKGIRDRAGERTKSLSRVFSLEWQIEGGRLASATGGKTFLQGRPRDRNRCRSTSGRSACGHSLPQTAFVDKRTDRAAERTNRGQFSDPIPSSSISVADTAVLAS